jgi:hypothetical protein
MNDNLAKIREALRYYDAKADWGPARAALALLGSLSAPDAKEGEDWISVKDRLPGDASLVVCRHESARPFLARCRNGKWLDDAELKRDPTHWMPLQPAAPAPEPKSWAEDRERRIYAGEVLLDVPTVKDSLTVPAPEPFVSKENPTTHLIEILPNPAYNPAPEPEGEGLAAALAAIEKAHDEVSALCHGKRWVMSVPAREDEDSDLVIANALHKAKVLLSRLSPPSPKEDE